MVHTGKLAACKRLSTCWGTAHASIAAAWQQMASQTHVQQLRYLKPYWMQLLSRPAWHSMMRGGSLQSACASPAPRLASLMSWRCETHHPCTSLRVACAEMPACSWSTPLSISDVEHPHIVSSSLLHPAIAGGRGCFVCASCPADENQGASRHKAGVVSSCCCCGPASTTSGPLAHTPNLDGLVQGILALSCALYASLASRAWPEVARISDFPRN